jgi:hypothetical protein
MCITPVALPGNQEDIVNMMVLSMVRVILVLFGPTTAHICLSGSMNFTLVEQLNDQSIQINLDIQFDAFRIKYSGSMI